MEDVKYCFQCGWANSQEEDACTMCANTEFTDNPELVLPPRGDIDQLTEDELQDLRSNYVWIKRRTRVY